jgi:hypothetical protein
VQFDDVVPLAGHGRSAIWADGALAPRAVSSAVVGRASARARWRFTSSFGAHRRQQDVGVPLAQAWPEMSGQGRRKSKATRRIAPMRPHPPAPGGVVSGKHKGADGPIASP